jgi:DNA topoisomerase-1
MVVDEQELLAARAAGLRHVADSMPGIRRTARGDTFDYVDANDKPVRDEETLARIRKLAVPPAWKNVWICASERGHLQATGRDARGRKQYRYHAKWRKERDQAKYGRLIEFADALPALRKKVLADMALQGLPREKVVATVVRLLDRTLIRVGNYEYARDNDSYGLTTMRSKHVEVKGSTLAFEFKGKARKVHSIDVSDARAARIVKQCRELPGYELFQYVDEEGEKRTVGSEDVNDYVRDAMGQDFTAKDFRTWAGTVFCATALATVGSFESEREAKANVNDAMRAVATLLGNTPAVSKACYVHPQLLESYLDGSFEQRWIVKPSRARSEYKLRPEEAATLAFLKRRARGARKAA